LNKRRARPGPEKEGKGEGKYKQQDIDQDGGKEMDDIQIFAGEPVREPKQAPETFGILDQFGMLHGQ